MAPKRPKMTPRRPQGGLPEPQNRALTSTTMHILLTCFLFANMPWNGHKIAPISSSVSPRWSQVNHKVPQDRLQDNTQGRLPHTCTPSFVARCLKMAPSASKMAPRYPKTSRRWLQDCLKMASRTSKIYSRFDTVRFFVELLQHSLGQPRGFSKVTLKPFWTRHGSNLGSSWGVWGVWDPPGSMFRAYWGPVRPILGPARGRLETPSSSDTSHQWYPSWRG